MGRVIAARNLVEKQTIIRRNSRGAVVRLIPVHDVRLDKCSLGGTHVNFGEFCYDRLAVVEVKWNRGRK